MFLILSLIIVAGIVFWYNTAKLNKNLKHLPTFPALPIIGHVHHLLFCNKRELFKVIQKFSKMSETKSLPFLLRIGPTHFFITIDPEEAKLHTNAFVDKPYFYGFTKEWIGNGIFTAPGDIWKRNIKRIIMCYNNNVINANIGVFNDQARELVNNLKLKNNKDHIDIMDDILSATFGSIYRIATGKTKSLNMNTIAIYYEALDKVVLLLLKRTFKFFYHSDHIYRLTHEYREYMKYVSVMRDIIDTVIETRIEERKAMNFNTDTYTGDNSNYQALLDYLLAINEEDPSFTLKQVQDEVHTLISAAFHTVSCSILFTLVLLSRNPDKQETLYTEIKSIMGDSARNVEKEDLNQMPYCDAVITESLRLLPPAPIAVRQADRNVDFGNYTVRKGDICALNIYGMGRSQRLWGEDAECFRPERWLNKKISNNATYAFYLGQRSCIGKKYAWVIMKIVLVHCIKELIFAGENRELEPEYEFLLKPGTGHLMKVYHRVQ